MTNRGFYRALVRALATDPTASVHVSSDGCVVIKTNEADPSVWTAVYCPLTYLGYRLGHGAYAMTAFVTAAAQFGLSATSARQIADAADGDAHAHAATVRALRTRLEPFQRTRPISGQGTADRGF